MKFWYWYWTHYGYRYRARGPYDYRGILRRRSTKLVGLAMLATVIAGHIRGWVT